MEVQLPVDEFDNLPEEYQAVIRSAAYDANATMMATYDALNPPALEEILADTSVTVAPFPDDVLRASEEAAFELYDENAAADSDFQSVFQEWSKFRDSITKWHALAERSYLDYRSDQA